MKKQLKHIAPYQAAKVVGLMHLVLSLAVMGIMVPYYMLTQSISIGEGVKLMVVLPLVYCVIGFVFTGITACVYNWIAQKFGGVKYTSVDVVAIPEQAPTTE